MVLRIKEVSCIGSLVNARGEGGMGLPIPGSWRYTLRIWAERINKPVGLRV